MDGPIASAVVLPEELAEPASPPHSLKRRQSSVSEDNAKRVRPNEDLEDTRRGSINGTKPAAPVRRERGRERRLFGAVLGALSQNPTTAAQKRRSEIEKRQMDRRKLEDEESEQRKAERIARRRVQRLKEQKRFENEAIRRRHENLLSMAHFLRTDTEPHLYYKPWETSPAEEERIRDQIAEARETIRREMREYEDNQSRQVERDRHNLPSRGEDNSYIDKSHNTIEPPASLESNRGTNGSVVSPKEQDREDESMADITSETAREDSNTENAQDEIGEGHETSVDEPHKDNDDENGEDIVEEAAEDTVIY